MRPRSLLYLLIVLNVADVVALSFYARFTPGQRPSPLGDVRSKLEASTSFDELRPRALLVMSARETADRAIANLHGAITDLIRLGVVSAATNLLLCLLIWRLLRV
jgi:hypothetical protein